MWWFDEDCIRVEVSKRQIQQADRYKYLGSMLAKEWTRYQV